MYQKDCISKFEDYIRNLPKTSKQIQLIDKLKIEKILKIFVWNVGANQMIVT